MTLRTQVLVAGAILGADGRKKDLRLGLRGPWREPFAACSNASLSLLLQLWRSFSTTRKTQLPGRGNRTAPTTGLLYSPGSTDLLDSGFVARREDFLMPHVILCYSRYRIWVAGVSPRYGFWAKNSIVRTP